MLSASNNFVIWRILILFGDSTHAFTQRESFHFFHLSLFAKAIARNAAPKPLIPKTPGLCVDADKATPAGRKVIPIIKKVL